MASFAKSILSIGTVAVALLAIGVGSAPAATLCATGGSPEAGCGAGKGEYTGTISETAGDFFLTTSSVLDFQCHSHRSLSVGSSTGSPVPVTVSQFSLTDCTTSSGTSCTLAVKNLPYDGSISEEALRITDEAGMAFLMKCGFLISCEFGTKEAEFSISNGSPTTITGTGIPLTRTGVGCPQIAEMEMTYEVTSPAGFTVH